MLAQHHVSSFLPKLVPFFYELGPCLLLLSSLEKGKNVTIWSVTSGYWVGKIFDESVIFVTKRIKNRPLFYRN